MALPPFLTALDADGRPPLNASQLRAVVAPDAPQLVLAGPGTGKTRVLTFRAAYLLRREVDRVPPSELVLVTFTRKAAGQLRQRLYELVGPDAGFARAGTLHHFAYGLVRGHTEHVGLPPDFVVADEAMTEPFWQQVLRDEDEIERLRDLQQAVSRLRLSLGTGTPLALRVMRRYEDWLAERGLVDFDGLIVYARDLLRDHADVRRDLQARCGAVLVDEFQDTDPVQFDILKRVMCPERQGLFAVADDDQSIYGFRGADVQNVRLYQKAFECRPGTPAYHVLRKNYRSSKRIFAVAESVLDPSDRMKRAGDVEAEGPDGERVLVVAHPNEGAEVEAVVEAIVEAVRGGRHACREIAVLTPSNARNGAFEEALLRRAVPCDVSGDHRLTEEETVVRLRAFLGLVHHLACRSERRGPRFDALVDAVLLLYGGEAVLHELNTCREHLAADASPSMAALRALAASGLAGRASDATAAATWILTIVESLADRLSDPATTVEQLVLALLPHVEQAPGLIDLVGDRIRTPHDVISTRMAGETLRQALRAGGRVFVDVEHPVLSRLYTIPLAFCAREHAPGGAPPKIVELGRTRPERTPRFRAGDVVVTDDRRRTAERLGDLPASLFGEEVFVFDLTPERAGDGPDELPGAPGYFAVDAEGRYESRAVRLFKLVQASAPAVGAGLRDYTVIDLETTSLDTAHCRVVEFGAVRVRGGEVADTFETKAALPEDLTPDERRVLREVSGFEPAAFDEAPTLEAAWRAFTDFVGTDALVAYNGALFDFPVLARLARELGETAPKRWGREHDMLLDARRLLPDLKSHTAEHVRRHLLGDDAPATEHRALSDCRDQHAVYERLVRLGAERRQARGFEPVLAAVAMAMSGERETRLRGEEERLLFQIGFLWFVRSEHPVVAEVRAALPQRLDPVAAITQRPHFGRALADLPPALQRARTAPRLMTRLRALLASYADRTIASGATAELLAFLALWNESDEALPPNVVTVSTYHSAKGLEFERVFATGVHDGAFPWWWLANPRPTAEAERERLESLKEARRVLYVGLTRAKAHLTISYPARGARGHPQGLSPFLREAPQEAVKRVRC